MKPSAPQSLVRHRADQGRCALFCGTGLDVLSLHALRRSFREGERLHRVLDNAHAEIRDGEFVAIVGRSGSGKSTLLNLISGIDAPDSGSIEFDGTFVSQLQEPERTRFRRRHVGFVYQFFNLIPTLNVEENVRLVLELDGVRGAPARRRAREVLEQVGLGTRLASAIDVLSGGEQQRVAIARALAHALRDRDLQISVSRQWRSPRGGLYPAEWRLQAPSLGLEVRLRPVLADQELDTTPRYWEGAVDVTGNQRGTPLNGRGYVELTGYANTAVNARIRLPKAD